MQEAARLISGRYVYKTRIPVPIIKMKEEMDKMKSGEVLEVLSTDTGIEPDTESWCKMTGNAYLGIEKKDNEYKVYVKKS